MYFSIIISPSLPQDTPQHTPDKKISFLLASVPPAGDLSFFPSPPGISSLETHCNTISATNTVQYLAKHQFKIDFYARTSAT